MSDKNVESKIENRTNYYRSQLENHLKLYHIDLDSNDRFPDFVDNPEAIELGDKLLSNGLSTGYNFALTGEIPIDNREEIVTYSIVAQRTLHLAKVLATMEERGMISEKDVSFVIRASKIRGDYEDKELVRRSLCMKDGTPETTLESVDLTLIFKPTNAGQAIDIVLFLVNEAPKIEGGYKDPDVRASATENFKRMFLKSGILKICTANVFKFKTGNLIALRQETKYAEEGWINSDNLTHPNLFDYLVIRDKNIKVES